MEKQFRSFISQNNIFTENDTILLALSGGIDSVVLFSLLLKQKIRFVVAHCNFGLRGKESDADQSFVKQLCKRNNIDFYSKKFETLNYAEIKGISIQMAARELRYTWFEGLRNEIGLNWIATAHHQTDVVETLLINLMRGTGIAGLHGISSKNGKIIRPLLFANKSDIEHYCKQNKLRFREDSSNLGDDYLRNKIRHRILPELKEINPHFEKSIFETTDRIAQAESVFNSAISMARKNIEEVNGSEIRYSIVKLKKLKPLSIYWFEFLKPYNFSTTSCLDSENCLGKLSGKQFYSDTHRLIIDRHFAVITKIDTTNDNTFFIPKTKHLITHPFKLKIKECKNSRDFILSKQRNIAQVDAAKLEFPVEIRKWKKGDFFYPLGMKGRKKLSDFFIDIKLSIFEKERIWLICSGNKIVWIVNHRLDERFKVLPETKQIIELEYLQT